MTTLEKLESLKDQVSSYAKLDYITGLDAVQTWKRQAKHAIRLIFDEYTGVRSLEEKIDQLFNSVLIASDGTSPLPVTPKNEIMRGFQSDVGLAVNIMDECTKVLKRLHEKYNPGGESFSDDTQEQMMTDWGNNHAPVVKKVPSPVIINRNRPSLSREASKALDDAMDAEEGRFDGTEYWN